jgi:alpha-D-ribose 1-methylphosphonate 5-triphosphate diphosphatase PhnM
MTDITQMYKRLAKNLSGSRRTLAEVCRDLNIDIESIDDNMLSHYVVECSHCDIWGTTHRMDEDDFPVCALCLRLVGG